MISTSSKSHKGIFYGYIIVAVSCLILAVEGGLRHSYGIFLPELCADLNWTRATVSGAASLLFFWGAPLGLIAGRLNDKYGPRLMLMISILAMGGGYALMSIMSTPWQLYIFYGIIVATGVKFGYLAATVNIPRWFVKRRGLAMGLTVTGTGLGALVIAPLAQFLISQVSWRTSFLILAGLLVAICLPISRLERHNPSEKGLVAYGSEEIKSKHSSPVVVGFSLKQTISTVQFWLLFVMMVSLNFVIQMVVIHLKAFAIGFGVPEMAVASAVGTIGGVSIISRIAIGGLSDKIGRKICFLICFFLLAMMMLWLMQAREPWQFYLFATGLGFGWGGCVPLFTAICGDWFGVKHLGSISGMLSVGVAIGGGIGPLLAGLIYDTTGSYNIAFLTGAVLCFISVLCSLVMKKPQLTIPNAFVEKGIT